MNGKRTRILTSFDKKDLASLGSEMYQTVDHPIGATEVVTLHVYSKSGLEKFHFPESFTGNVALDFRQGGLGSMKKGETIK